MINFSALPRESVIGRLVRLPLSLIPARARVRVLQGPAVGMRWIAGASLHGCWLGSYEAAVQRLFAQWSAGAMVVYDIGANVGLYTLIASRAVRPGGRVVAVEPVPRNLEFIRKHCAINSVTNVRIAECAVTRWSGPMRFAFGQSHETGRVSPDGELVVRGVSLDDLVDLSDTGLPDVIKIDVEGAEVDVLNGARRVFSGKRPRLIIAVHSEALKLECAGLLREFQYTILDRGAGRWALPADILAAE